MEPIALSKGLPDKVLVPPGWHTTYNIAFQSATIFAYSLLLIYLLHNSYKYLFKLKRYTVLTHTVFYSFAILLAIGRIYQHACAFEYLTNYKIRLLNGLDDGFTVCVGISQVVVIAEIVFAMELFKQELNEMDDAEVCV